MGGTRKLNSSVHGHGPTRGSQTEKEFQDLIGVMACRIQVVETDEVTWTGVAFHRSLAESEWLLVLLACDFRPIYYCYLTLRDRLREP